jgi:hypothetical protein
MHHKSISGLYTEERIEAELNGTDLKSVYGCFLPKFASDPGDKTGQSTLVPYGKLSATQFGNQTRVVIITFISRQSPLERR